MELVLIVSFTEPTLVAISLFQCVIIIKINDIVCILSLAMKSLKANITSMPCK